MRYFFNLFLNDFNQIFIMILPIESESSIFLASLVERGVAQSGSAVALGAIGRGFESLRPDWVLTKSEIRLSEI